MPESNRQCYSHYSGKLLADFITQTTERVEFLSHCDLTAHADQTLAELQTTLEELRVTEEELRAQNEALEEALLTAELERQRFQRLFDEAPDGYIVTDAAGLILNANWAAGRLLARTPERLQNKPLAIFVAENRRLDFRALLTSAVRQMDPVHTALRLHPPHAKPSVVSVSAAGEVGSDGQTSVRWILRDVTEHMRVRKVRRAMHREKAARRALQNTVRRLRFIAAVGRALMAETSAEISRLLTRVGTRFLADDCEIFVKDDQAGYRSLSRSSHSRAVAERIDARRRTIGLEAAGGPLATVLETGNAQLFPPLDVIVSSTREVLAAVRGSTPRFGIVAPVKVQDRTLGALCLLCVDDHELGPEEIGTSLDLGNRLAIALDQLRLKQEAEAGNKAKAQFLGVVSHELRTPLSAVIGYAELLLEGVAQPLEPTAKLWVERVLLSARHQVRLVNDLLMYARFDREPETITLHEVNVRQIVNDAVAVVRPVIDDSGVQLEVIAADLSVRTDPHKVMQILINLLWNAQKFTPRGKITIAAEVKGEQLCFSVTDTGIGIADADLSHVFEPFWQSDQTDARAFGGAGLGLAVSRKIAEQLGGQLVVTSELGVGSTFRLCLPTNG